MSSLCSDPEVAFAVGDKLRELSLKYPTLRVTASGFAHAIGSADVGMVQNALIDAASQHLLKAELRHRCSECGSANDYVGEPVDDLECILHGEIPHDTVAVYEFTDSLHRLAEKRSPKKAARRSAPLFRVMTVALRALVRFLARTR